MLDLDSQKKCLEYAEQILSSLDDKALYERYLAIKNKMISSNSVFSKTIDENIAFQTAISSEINKNNPPISLHNYVIQELYKIQTKILPDTSSIISKTIDEAIQTLYDTINTKFIGHNFAKSHLTQKNSKISKAIKEMRSTAQKEVEDSRKNRLLNIDNWEFKKTKIIDLQKNAIVEKAQLEKQTKRLQENNIEIKNDIAKLQVSIRDKKHELEEIEQHIMNISEEIIDLKTEAEKLKYQVTLANKANENLKGIKKYQPKNPNIIREKQKLLDEIEVLRRRNQDLNASLTSRGLMLTKPSTNNPLKY